MMTTSRVLGALLILTAAVSCTDANALADAPPLATRVDRALKADPALVAVQVDVAGDTVILTGDVPSLADRRHASNVVLDLDTVPNVLNQVRIRPRSDEYLRSAVQAELALAKLSWVDVFVAVDDGVVTLTGTARSATEKRSMADAIDDVAGIVRIRNLVRVAPTEAFDRAPIDDIEVPDDPAHRLERSVRDSLDSLPVDTSDVFIAATADGSVTLSGSVATWNDYNAVQQGARTTGVETLINQLDVLRAPGADGND